MLFLLVHTITVGLEGGLNYMGMLPRYLTFLAIFSDLAILALTRVAIDAVDTDRILRAVIAHTFINVNSTLLSTVTYEENKLHHYVNMPIMQFTAKFKDFKNNIFQI